MDDVKITLGGRELSVRPLKLGQLRGLMDALNEMQDKTGGASIDAAAKLVSIGLPHENLSIDEILESDAALDELNEAVATVIRVAGRLKARDTGEAEPQPAA